MEETERVCKAKSARAARPPSGPGPAGAFRGLGRAGPCTLGRSSSSDALLARCASSPDPQAHRAAYSWLPASHTHRGVFRDGTLPPPPLSSLTWQPQDRRRRPTPPSVGETGVFKLCFSETSCSWPSYVFIAGRRQPGFERLVLSSSKHLWRCYLWVLFLFSFYL